MTSAPPELKRRYDGAVRGLTAPLAILDVEAYRANAADLVRRAHGRPIRLATKSLRVRSVIEEVAARPGFAGLLSYSLAEALFLVRSGSSTDVVVAYPSVDHVAIADLSSDEAARAMITLMVDCREHLDLIEAAVRGRAAGPIRVAIDVDASWRPLGDRVHVGVRRSPVRTPAEAVALALEVQRRPGLHLDGLMAYEAQIAGVGDRPPGARARGFLIRQMQTRSAAELAERRAEVVGAVQAVAPLRFVNGGGTGSLERTSAEDAITEVSAGSGVFGPHLFDSYSTLRPRPAALFALPVVRRPAPGWVTLFSGGFLASGPADAARLPQVHLPDGLSLARAEGAGEVQTPLHGAPADHLRIGDLVWLRHAKGGELAERFSVVHRVLGPQVIDRVATYRGEGRCFG